MEQKKLLWVIFSAVGFVLVVAVLGLVVFWPSDERLSIEKESIRSSTEREFDPIEWVHKNQEYPGIEEQEVVYGENGEVAQIEGEEAVTREGAPEGDAESAIISPESEEMKKPGIEIEVYKPSEKPDEKVIEASRIVTPEPEPTSVRVTEYWIQAGSYASMIRAEEVKKRLAEKGIASIITTKSVEDTQYYRVRIGPYASNEEAEKFLGWIKGITGFESSYVSMVYIQKRLN
jgi:cell division protein FtsN